MTLNDLLKRVKEEDRDKMFILREDKDHKGWANVDFYIKDNEITVVPDKGLIFSSDK